MALAAGTRLGPYEIVAPLGAGGMGEVYRARDTRLDRTVAVKVLPGHLSHNPELRQRFEREARAASSLNHPHICTLHDVGRQDGIDFLVMEYLDGETVASRLERGAMPAGELLRCATEVADALDKAHRQGLVHRDLKPANVMLTKSGAKLLDFGLAKSTGPATGSALLSAAPTATTPLTGAGSVVGTFQYMAPEQLEGKEVDARTDIFAFGVILYEMATGRRAFTGKTQASLIAAILKDEPRPIRDTQPASPVALDRLLRICMAKDPDDRRQTMRDVLLDLRAIAGGGWDAGGAAPGMPGSGATDSGVTASGIAAPGSAVASRARPTWLAWGAAALLLPAGFAAGFLLRQPAPAPLLRASLVLPRAFSLDTINASVALSPDGLTVALAGSEGGQKQRIWVRPLDSLTARPLDGTDDATYPFWSPDGRFIGFFADRKLKKIPADGGTVQTICDAADGRGADWSRDGAIVFTPGPFEGLFRVPASGGSPVRLTTVEKAGDTHRLPRFLPDGRRLLFVSGNSTDTKENSIRSLDLETGEGAVVAAEHSEGRYLEPGYLAFVRDGNLLVQSIDPQTLRIGGEAVPVAEQVQFYPPRYTGNYSLTEAGLLLYQDDTTSGGRQLTWLDLDGKELGKVGEPALFQSGLQVAPDGRRAVAMMRGAESSELWIYDLARGVGSRFTFGPGQVGFPIWSPDGRQIAYTSGVGDILLKAADGTSEPRTLLSDKSGFRAPTSWSPDGSLIALNVQTSESGWDMWILPLTGDPKPYPFLATVADEFWGTFSPDGKWLLYRSDESGKDEIYVVPFPGREGKWQISSGVVRSRPSQTVWWVGDGRRILYLTPEDKLMAVDVTVRGANLEIGASRPLFGGRPLRRGAAALTRDGTRILQAMMTEEATSALTLVTDWRAALKQ